ncbi:MAG TPA: DeoR/GlpR family DNA-binding transcription regulator [Candidatus Limnocylindria bacterium]|jgi:DeoR/GlpR family transcriptional regulator of sugar metabolism|nr:DeoR/GlpR family DNA-binding transcription regulator [Candidatus Limnocylindria bacterium]
MLPEQRRKEILGLANDQVELTVEEIAQRFGVSRETARRDLVHLDARGLLRRIHGGALKSQAASEPTLSDRMTENAEAKRRIARVAARCFEENDTLMIDTGSTTAFFAEELANFCRVTVITNSLAVATRLWSGTARHRVYLIGGEFNGERGETLGSVSLDQLSGFRADHAVITVGAIDAVGGFMDYDLEEAMIARTMIQQARSVTVIADRSKFDHVAMAQVCELSAVARLITDQAPPGPLTEALRAAGVEVLWPDV